VSDALVVLGGVVPRVGVTQGLVVPTSRVEMLSNGAGAFVELLPLSCGAVYAAVAIAVDESHSVAGQVLLLGGRNQDGTATLSVRLVDLATGICTLQADFLNARSYFAAARLPDGGIICVGGTGRTMAEMWERPVQGALEAAWTGRELSAMSVGCGGCSGCVLSDGRFAVLGGCSTGRCASSTCEAWPLGDDGHWLPLPPMHDTLIYSASAGMAGCIIVVAGCIIVGGGGILQRKSAEVYDEVLGRWLRLPHDLPHDG
jgi:hypothetical protein